MTFIGLRSNLLRCFARCALALDGLALASRFAELSPQALANRLWGPATVRLEQRQVGPSVERHGREVVAATVQEAIRQLPGMSFQGLVNVAPFGATELRGAVMW